jgi:hypothetical protein
MDELVWALAHLGWMVLLTALPTRCLLQVKLIPDALECTPRDVFVAQSYNVPALLARYVGASQVDLYPIQVRSDFRFIGARALV